MKKDVMLRIRKTLFKYGILFVLASFASLRPRAVHFGGWEYVLYESAAPYLFSIALFCFFLAAVFTIVLKSKK